MNNLDKFSFGNTKAATDLADIISKSQDKKIRKQVASFLHRFNHLINQIDVYLPLERNNNINCKRILLGLVKDSFVPTVDSRNWPKIVKILVRCIMVTNYRAAYHANKKRNDLTRKLEKGEMTHRTKNILNK